MTGSAIATRASTALYFLFTTNANTLTVLHFIFKMAEAEAHSLKPPEDARMSGAQNIITSHDTLERELVNAFTKSAAGERARVKQSRLQKVNSRTKTIERLKSFAQSFELPPNIPSNEKLLAPGTLNAEDTIYVNGTLAMKRTITELKNFGQTFRLPTPTPSDDELSATRAHVLINNTKRTEEPKDFAQTIAVSTLNRSEAQPFNLLGKRAEKEKPIDGSLLIHKRNALGATPDVHRIRELVKRHFSPLFLGLFQDINVEDLQPDLAKVIGAGRNSLVFQYMGLAYRTHCTQRAYDLQMKAGECAARPSGRVMIRVDGKPVCVGMLMMLHTPLDVEKVRDEEKVHLKNEMIRLVATLHHKYGIVHGDIKQENFLRCADGTLRLCDFDCARGVNEDHGEWDHTYQTHYLAPHRRRNNYKSKKKPPVISDDMYTLGLSIFALYSGKTKAFFTLRNFGGVNRYGLMVDLNKIPDIPTRLFVEKCLLRGGATLDSESNMIQAAWGFRK